MSGRKYTYSEIFNSIQGEGVFTGQWTLWLRFFLCNLQCNGFGQKHPTKPETWELPYQDFDVSLVNRVEDLPVWDKGCDSSYTWAKKYKHLMAQKTAKDIYVDIKAACATKDNPQGTFFHPRSKQTADMCFTGGEPLMMISQMAVMELYQQFKGDNNLPRSITFETNGTQKLSKDFKQFLTNRGTFNTPILFSVSPKLWTVAGEKRQKAIKPEVVAEYYQIAQWIRSNTSNTLPSGQLKFVVGSDTEQWEELEEVVNLYRAEGIDWPVFIMPVGATVEDQEREAGEIARIAFQKGYNVSGRLHCYLWGNAIGT